MLQQVGEVLTRVLPPGEEQSDLAILPERYDAAGEDAGALVLRLARQLQDAHAGVVIVQHLALRSLPDQLVEGWLGNCRCLFH